MLPARPLLRAYAYRQAGRQAGKREKEKKIHKSSRHTHTLARAPLSPVCGGEQTPESPRVRYAALKPNTLYKRLGLVNAHQSVGCFVLPEGTLAEFRKMHDSVRVCLVL